ncbi:MAG TPA: DNA gyrase inhibitor YacG [Isosphaeraceae bacterium]
MIRGRCPICGKNFEVAAIDDLPSFPFCSDRCKLVDLGRWIDGAYSIPGTPSPEPQKADQDEE